MPGPGGTIFLTDGNDHFPDPGDDNSGNEWIYARNGNDTVLGGIGGDTIFGEGADDQLFGEDGFDYLDGGDGSDRLEGGAGNDTITDYQGALTFIDGGAGDDDINITSFQQGSVVNGGSGRDRLQLGDTTALNLIRTSGIEDLNYYSTTGTVTAKASQFEGLRSITAFGGEVLVDFVTLALFGRAGHGYNLDLSDELRNLAVYFIGTFGNDTITTGGGNDTVFGGGDGNDQLSGGKGRDDLHGSGGNDTLIGGLGRDVLTGGADDDTYVYNSVADAKPSNGSNDLIIGWSNGDDTINLSAVGAFTFMGPGDGHGAGQIWYTVDAFSTTVLIYVDGDASADMVIGIAEPVLLAEADFV